MFSERLPSGRMLQCCKVAESSGTHSFCLHATEASTESVRTHFITPRAVDVSFVKQGFARLSHVRAPASVR